MTHPWLDIPIADYEAHMALPSVGQAQLLSAALERTVARSKPRSLAVLGVAGGNGLEAIKHAGVQRLVALDFNSDYLALCSRRFASSFPKFEPVWHDLSRGPPLSAPVDCVFAGLVLEYLPVDAFCDYLPDMLTPRGQFAVLLQLPAPGLPEVSATPYASLARLESAFSFVDPAQLDASLLLRGFSRIVDDRHDLASGKSFHYAAWQAPAEA